MQGSSEGEIVQVWAVLARRGRGQATRLQTPAGERQVAVPRGVPGAAIAERAPADVPCFAKKQRSHVSWTCIINLHFMLGVSLHTLYLMGPTCHALAPPFINAGCSRRTPASAPPSASCLSTPG